MAKIGEIILLKFFSILFFICLSAHSSELEEITKLLKKTHKDCGEFVLLSDRLLCYRRVKKEHRALLNSYLAKLEEEKSIPQPKINKLRKEILSKLEIAY